MIFDKIRTEPHFFDCPENSEFFNRDHLVEETVQRKTISWSIKMRHFLMWNLITDSNSTYQISQLTTLTKSNRSNIFFVIAVDIFGFFVRIQFELRGMYVTSKKATAHFRIVIAPLYNWIHQIEIYLHARLSYDSMAINTIRCL